MKVTWVNDTKETVHVYKNTVAIENKIGTTTPLDEIEFEVDVTQQKGLFIKMWKGVLLVGVKS